MLKIFNKYFKTNEDSKKDFSEKDKIVEEKQNPMDQLMVLKSDKKKVDNKIKKLEDKIENNNLKVSEAYGKYKKNIKKNDPTYKLRNSLAKDKVNFNDVWESKQEYWLIENKVYKLNNKLLEKIDLLKDDSYRLLDSIQKIEDEIIYKKIKSKNNLFESDAYRNKFLLEVSTGKFIDQAKLQGYIPATEFLILLSKYENESSVEKFIEQEPSVIKKGKNEVFVLLTEGMFSYDIKESSLIFDGGIHYEKIEKKFNELTVNDIKQKDIQNNEFVEHIYESGEVFERINLKNKFIKLHKNEVYELIIWEKIKNKYETGYYESDEERLIRDSKAEESLDKKLKSSYFINNTLPLYKSFYSKIKNEIFEEEFYEDKKKQLIKEFWLNAEVDYKKSKNGDITQIKPCFHGHTSSKNEYKYVFNRPNFSYDKETYRVYQCENWNEEKFYGWHLTTKLEQNENSDYEFY